MIKSVESKSQRRYWQSTEKLFKWWITMMRADIWDIRARETVIWEQPRKWSGKRSCSTWPDQMPSSHTRASNGFFHKQRYGSLPLLSGTHWVVWEWIERRETIVHPSLQERLALATVNSKCSFLSSRKHTQVRKAHCPWQYWHRSSCCIPRDACDMGMCLEKSCWQV